MGSSIKHSSFTDEDYEQFSLRVRKNLEQLSELLQQPDFGIGKSSLGAELELTLIDKDGQAKWLNQKIIDLTNDPQLTLELNQYNLEYNLCPLATAGAPFSAIAREISTKLEQLNQIAAPLGTRTVAIGILPTLTLKDIGAAAMSDCHRYRGLTKSVKKMRGAPFEINIDGLEPLLMKVINLNAEGANTSFQIHLRVEPKEFVNCYNATQMATALALAVSTNSPIFLDHRLWEETRVPLFKQAVETRGVDAITQRQIARTGLGSGWIKHSPLELFQRSVDDFDTLLPECDDGDDTAINGAPELCQLRIHHGTIWHWNRAIYDPALGGHLRIEMRALPSGPSAIDMAANAAFFVGLSKALSHRMEEYITRIDFDSVKSNFYRAAELGLDAPIIWPKHNGKLQELPAHQLITEMIPLAQRGLEELEVRESETRTMLAIIQQRLDKRITGARWQLQTLQKLEQEMNRKQALDRMLFSYLKNFDGGKPVHQWSLE